MPKSNSFKLHFDIIFHYDDKFWDDCLQYYRIMYWATDSLAIQINPVEQNGD